MSDKPAFSTREMEIMGHAWSCMTEEPKVDYTKLAELCGMPNPRSAANAWATIKKKILTKGGANKADDGDLGETDPGATPRNTPKTTPKRKKGIATPVADRDDDDGASPSKKTKPTKSKAKAKPTKSEATVEDEADGSPVKEDPDAED